MNQNLVMLPSAQAQEEPKRSKKRNLTSDGRRCVRVDAGTDPATGKRIRKAFYGKTLREAQIKAEEFRRAQREGLDVASQSQSLSAWIDAWLETYGSRAGYSTNTIHRLNAEKLRASLGSIRLCDVRQVHIQHFADEMAHYSKSSVSKLRVTTQMIFRTAIANRIIVFDPCTGVNWASAGSGTHRALTHEEIALISRNWSAHRAGLWAMLMLFAGLRRGEALALTWDDVDLEAGVIHVRHGIHFETNTAVLGDPKTATSVRDVPILPPLRTVLTNCTRLSDTWVCTGAEGQQVTQSIWASSWSAWLNTMSNILNGDTKTAVCPGRRSDKDTAPRARFDVRAHDLRHTYVTMLYDAGVDVKTTQRLVGHASPDITMRIYTHLSEAKQQASMAQLSAFAASFSVPE